MNPPQARVIGDGKRKEGGPVLKERKKERKLKGPKVHGYQLRACRHRWDFEIEHCRRRASSTP